MRAVIQRVSHCEVTVGTDTAGRIGPGLLVLLGVRTGDTEADADYLADKTGNLRIFPDEADRMNLSVIDTGGEVLVVSQFTLYGDCRKGRRPSYNDAARPEVAERLYDYYVAALHKLGTRVATGRFQAMMAVGLVNEGPVTILLDSGKHF